MGNVKIKPLKKPLRYRSVFISDVHLGTKGCQAYKLIRFLKSVECENLYLVGDIIDGWRMKRALFWPKSHNEVIRQILKKAKNGTMVYYIAGNHDEFLRDWLLPVPGKGSEVPQFLGNVKISNREEYRTSDGRKFLVVHGDMFDVMMRKNLKWLMHVGDFSYNALIWVNTRFNWIREKFGLPYWSLSNYLKQKTKRAIRFISDYKDNMAEYAMQKRYDGVICGHIHQAEISERYAGMQGNENKFIQYVNTGDWVESCTAVVEREDRKGLHLVTYNELFG